ncbi:chemotaxis protein [Aureimonas endophytica]|uniref:Chemotaxis protein n=1 Tax=Aureimonas endophytica TaxID=2027858 RepID=A0A917A0A7_9HYPH|nr:methyl-accepting chemotaxis protein [Aureimonas endophytica]GGE20473.1 chemotaxis protein [Aureimonas endophytica]
MLKHIAISRKIAGCFAVLLCIALGVGGFVYRNLTSTEATMERQVLHAKLQLLAGDMRFAMTRQENSLRGFMLTRDPYYSGRVLKHNDTFRGYLAEARAAAGGQKDILAKLDRLDERQAGWLEKIAKPALVLAADPAKTAEAAKLITSDEAASYLDPAEESVNGLRDGEKAEFDASTEAMDADAAHSRLALLLGFGSLVLASGALGFGLSRAIARPVVTLRDAMLKLVRGDLATDVPARERGDEIGAMAKAVETFKQTAIEQRRLEAETAASRAASEDQRSRQSAIDHAKAEDLRHFVHAVEAGFERLSAGDLTVRMDGGVAPEFEPIRQTFNQSVAALEAAITAVVGSVGTIRTGLGEINVAAGDLSQRTEQQAASLEETVAALSEVTRGINGTADVAARAEASASTAKKNAEAGGAIVGRAVEAMSKIENSSIEIGKIIGVIDEIAFQTNLLALNAGVEAARAGESGKGFAVVAQEVRALAQRSAEAAKEIKTLIGASATQVGEGVELVSATGRALDEIVGQVGHVAETIAGIAHSAREQATSLKEVATAADQMDKVTQQNAAMVEETTAAAQSLGTETAELAALTSRFRTAGSSAPSARAAPSRPRVVPQLRSTGRGGAAPKPAAAADDWEEF